MGFVNGRGEKIYCRSWPAQLKSSLTPRGVVLILHGYGEHCGLYDHIARILAENELEVAAHDHAGFGQSEGDRAHIADYHHYVDDVIQHVDLLQETHPDLPFFIVAHSLGGMIGLLSALVLKERLRGLVLLAPLIIPKDVNHGKLAGMVTQLISWICPQYIITEKMDSKMFCTDQDYIRRFEEDPLVYHQGMRAKFLVETDKGLAYLKSHFSDVTCPLMLIHGGADPLCDVRGSEKLHAESGSRDKSINIYKGMMHQVHNEPGEISQRCLTSMKDWILARTSG